ncbi:MAG: hypothetical protein AVDCRST_MAG88-3674 [uncultured Thermomicrobiales bacterium]|uniref:Uncharacterized protein n=1 Tax=uncultured Thermomicrobiales bacterium TaxID=1645740 RepID=A0A6J4VN69_9BACT|nr:MAG: hypothetical protein AVDCRST_MAG88-3674 [uncultured Thermomicrobiales bacterium]
MRTITMVLFGLLGGFAAGVVLSAIIGLAGVLLFDRAVGIRFLPLYLAGLGAVIVPAVGALVRHRAH